jgi:Mg2+/Co2+ transporter CorB
MQVALPMFIVLVLITVPTYFSLSEVTLLTLTLLSTHSLRRMSRQVKLRSPQVQAILR